MKRRKIFAKYLFTNVILQKEKQLSVEVRVEEKKTRVENERTLTGIVASLLLH